MHLNDWKFWKKCILQKTMMSHHTTPHNFFMLRKEAKKCRVFLLLRKDEASHNGTRTTTQNTPVFFTCKCGPIVAAISPTRAYLMRFNQSSLLGPLKEASAKKLTKRRSRRSWRWWSVIIMSLGSFSSSSFFSGRDSCGSLYLLVSWRAPRRPQILKKTTRTE